MTVYFDATQAIIARMDTLWTTTEKVFDNEQFVPTARTPFVGLSVNFFEANQTGLAKELTNNRRFRHFGTIDINILTVVNEGTGLGLEYADSISEIFRSKEFSGVVTQAPVLLSQQQIKYETGNWWSTPLTVAFWIDQNF